MDAFLVTASSAAISIAVALAGVWAARKKGLPALNAEVESRNSKLIEILEGTVRAMEDEFSKCKGNLQRALDDNESLRQRVNLAENDLLTLYREHGLQVPRRLTARGRREANDD